MWIESSRKTDDDTVMTIAVAVAVAEALLSYS